MLRRLILGGVGASALALCAAIGCAGKADPSGAGTGGPAAGGAAAALPTTYVGELKGAPAGSHVAVVVDGNAFTAYVCSGDAAFNATDSRWFRGPLAAGKGAAAVDGREFAVEVKGAAAAVSIKSGDKVYTASAADVGEAEAGLYRLDEKEGDQPKVTGWILSADGAIAGNTQIGTKTKNFTLPSKNFNGADKLGLVAQKLNITSVTNEFNVGGGGESVDFTINWNASSGALAKIVRFDTSLKATYATGNPVTKTAQVAADGKSVKIRVPNILQNMKTFEAKVVMVLQGKTDPRQFRVTATKAGSF